MTGKLYSRETSHNHNTVLPQNISSSGAKHREINFISNLRINYKLNSLQIQVQGCFGSLSNEL